MPPNNSNLAETYQMKTDIEHILHNPDTYVGSVENTETDSHVYDGNKKIVAKEILLNPGLYKLFDEAIVNCTTSTHLAISCPVRHTRARYISTRKSVFLVQLEFSK